MFQEAANVRVVIEAGRGGHQECFAVMLQEVEDQVLEGRGDLGFGQLPEVLPQFLAVIGGGLIEQVRVVPFQAFAHIP